MGREVFETAFAGTAVQQLLDELEIDETDRLDLFSVLDSDGSGVLTVDELIQGIMAVRGHAKKSDVIATRLAVKSVQRSLRAMQADERQSRHAFYDAIREL